MNETGQPLASISDYLGIPALSIRQPWAWAIVNVGKAVENRTWPTKYRGPVLIHASKGCTQLEYLDACDVIVRAVDDKYRGQGIRIPGWKQLDRGGIVGVAEIVDCVSESDSPWFFGPYGFVLRDARPLPFTPCKGSLGLFVPDLEAAG